MLLMNGLLNAAHWFMYLAIAFSLPDNLKFVLEYVHVALWVLLPVTGWVAESWLGRYRAIAVGLVLSSVTILTLQAAFIMLQFDWTPIPAFVLIVVGLVIGTLGIGSFYTIMLPFALDQMIGASAEELSAAVQWYCWGITIGNLFEDILQCVPIPNQLQPWEILQIISLTIGTLCWSAALIMDCLYHKWLDTNNTTGNPIKLIYQVLNYARKNKCPRRRSALTYIDEEHPSRLDFGKHKFGGPFTEEEVEDVKTIFRLSPLLVLAYGVYFFCELELSHIPTKKTFECDFIAINCLYFVLIPGYHFFIYPFICSHIPSMLKMIGAGLMLCLVSTVVSTAVTATVQFSHNITMADSPQVTVPLYWVIVVDLLNGLGAGITTIYTVEFVMAQTPNRMRGIMMGLVIIMIGWSTLGSPLLLRIFHMFKVSQRFTFYFYLTLPLLAMLVLMIFIIVAKRYKLRERERHVNIQAIVEEHYERYFDQEEEYMREAAANYSAININSQ